MIKYFEVENFKSIKDKVVMEFDLNIAEFQTDNQRWQAHPVIAFYGSNASGKTAVLQALTFVFWFMRNSFLTAEPNSNIPREPFILNENDAPTIFQLILEIGGVEYTYVLECNDQKVIKEELYVGDEPEFIRVGNNLQESATRLDNVDDLRENCSIISYAAQFNSQVVAKKLKEFSFWSNCTKKGFTDRGFNPKVWADLKGKFSEKAKEMLQLADIGIVDFGRKEGESKELDKVELLKMLENEEIEKPENREKIQALKSLVELLDPAKIKQEPRSFVLHTIEDKEIELDPSNQQSEGTKRFATLILKVLEAFENGGILVLDEFETNLHQDLAAYVLGLFSNPSENINNSQLIISSHNSHFMDYLNPEQVWFATKNKGVTDVYSAAKVENLSNVKERLNLYYKIGRFGAKPPALPFEQTYFPKK